MGSTPRCARGEPVNDLTVVTQQYTDRAFITVRGEMDLHSCPRLARAAAMIPLGGKRLYIDLSGVPFMDSSGLNLLIWLHRRLDAEGGLLSVTGLQSQPERLLHITETHTLLTTAAKSLA
ncbi:hypothetical protein DMT42_00335 [Streptomyces actuosus]|uniref:Anti-sigma factor antagonist n=1 Tax=Streptomyces actuosus TaxID=1885 RepID=A0A2U9NVT8_STRAS|nr:hypothetical protein DMT42_00335 [Streptomyces actuosus]